MLKHILVPLDGSSLAERVLPVACALCERTGAALTLLHVLEKHPPATVHAEHHLAQPAEAEHYLAGAAQSLTCGPRIERHAHTDRVGDVGRSIVDHADEIGADLIAITTHGAGGMKRALFGSIAQQVLARCRQPVLVIPTPYRPPVKVTMDRFLVPVDLNPVHAPAIDYSIELARRCAARLILLGVRATAQTLTGMPGAAAQVQPFAAAALLEAERGRYVTQMELIQSSSSALGVASEIVMDQGTPAGCILRRIEQHSPDLVIFASHRRRGLEAVLTGSIGQQLCNHSTSPLLIIPL